ncbi:MAG: GldG family protein [candidate division Zixibacteria bacterium]|nr:GldG family protein [candidate division Zixibacteria bacterium]
MEKLIPVAGYVGLILVLVGAYGYATDAMGVIVAVLLLLAGAALLATFAVFEWNLVRATLEHRSTRYGANAAAMTLILVGILTFVNLIGSRYSQRIDTTANQRFNLADLTVNVLRGLKQDVHIVGFMRSQGAEASAKFQLEDLLDQYRYHSKRVSYEFVDPDREPAIARQYNIMGYGTIVFESAGKTEHITRTNEEALTNAIVKVTRQGQKTVYFLEGHGEHSINLSDPNGYTQLQQALQNQSYTVKSLSLLSENKVPDDCSVLVVAGAKKDLLSNEATVLETYLKRGGRALFLIDPDFPAKSADFSSMLSAWAVRIGNDVVVDPSPASRMLGMGVYAPSIQQYIPHPITQNFRQASILPITRSIDTGQVSADSVEIQTIAMTGTRSWSEKTFPQNVQEAMESEPTFDEGPDQMGPISVAVAVTADPKIRDRDLSALTPQELATEPDEHELKTRLVVIGNSIFAANVYFALPGNGDFIMNSINWLAEEEDLIAIRPKSSDTRLVQISLTQMWNIFIITGLLAPIGILIAGIVVWWKRRN